MLHLLFAALLVASEDVAPDLVEPAPPEQAASRPAEGAHPRRYKRHRVEMNRPPAQPAPPARPRVPVVEEPPSELSRAMGQWSLDSLVAPLSSPLEELEGFLAGDAGAAMPPMLNRAAISLCGCALVPVGLAWCAGYSVCMLTAGLFAGLVCTCCLSLPLGLAGGRSADFWGPMPSILRDVCFAPYWLGLRLIVRGGKAAARGVSGEIDDVPAPENGEHG